MQSKMKSFWLILVAFSISIFLITAPVRADKVLKVYTNVDIDEMEKWAPEAEKVIGMKIEWSRMSSGELWSRVQAEAPNFQADMIWGFANADALIGTQRGWFIPYKSPAWADIPAEYKDPEDHWYGYNYWFSAAAVNTKLIKEKNLPKPKSWMDLANPAYKGELERHGLRFCIRNHADLRRGEGMGSPWEDRQKRCPVHKIRLRTFSTGRPGRIRRWR
jgi:iron(III) transport system substrate-binding protein